LAQMGGPVWSCLGGTRGDATPTGRHLVASRTTRGAELRLVHNSDDSKCTTRCQGTNKHGCYWLPVRTAALQDPDILQGVPEDHVETPVVIDELSTHISLVEIYLAFVLALSY